MEIDTILKETEDKMSKSIIAIKNDLGKMRTGSASTSILENIKVDYYGSLTNLSQMASISVSDPCLILVQPWDISSIKVIEKAIMKSDLGLSPSNDGKIIRVPIPKLTETRRKDLVKLVKKSCEEYKVAIRNIRREANDFLKREKKNKNISEDDLFRSQEGVQKITNKYIINIESIENSKVKEIIEF